MKDCRVFGFAVLLIGLFIFGCGGSGDDKSQQTKSPEEMTEEDKIKASMTALIERLMEGDKTVLYEHEFDCFKDETSLSGNSGIIPELEGKIEDAFGLEDSG